MRKELFFVIAICLFLAVYAMDYLAGSVRLTARNPIVFLTSDQISKFPLTFAAIVLRSLALFITTVLTLSLVEKRYFTKAIVTLVIIVIAEMYAVQQMATLGRLTTMQWTLSISYAGILLLPVVGFYILKGIVTAVKSGLKKEPEEKASSSVLLGEEGEE
jgi:hypothetical protein